MEFLIGAVLAIVAWMLWNGLRPPGATVKSSLEREKRRREREASGGDRERRDGDRGRGGPPGGGPVASSGGPGGGGRGGPGGSGWRNASPEQRNTWRRDRLDSGSPESRGMRAEYRRQMQERREQRGLPNNGRGWF